MMADCEFCEKLIQDVEEALYDGDHWFCSFSCRGKWQERSAGNVPA